MNKVEVSYKKSVGKDFKKIDRQYRYKLKKKIDKKLSDVPYSGEQLKGKFDGLWKLRLGEYRVLYIIQKNKVTVVRLGIRQGGL